MPSKKAKMIRCLWTTKPHPCREGQLERFTNLTDEEKPAPPSVVKPEGKPAKKPVRKNFFLRPRSDGVPDILDEVQEHGGIRAPGPNAGGEYDGYNEAMTGAAALLRRSQGSGLHIDDMVAQVQKNFPRIQSADDLKDPPKPHLIS